MKRRMDEPQFYLALKMCRLSLLGTRLIGIADFVSLCVLVVAHAGVSDSLII